MVKRSLVNYVSPVLFVSFKVWFQNRRMKFKRQRLSGTMEMDPGILGTILNDNAFAHHSHIRRCHHSHSTYLPDKIQPAYDTGKIGKSKRADRKYLHAGNGSDSGAEFEGTNSLEGQDEWNSCPKAVNNHGRRIPSGNTNNQTETPFCSVERQVLFAEERLCPSWMHTCRSNISVVPENGKSLEDECSPCEFISRQDRKFSFEREGCMNGNDSANIYHSSNCWKYQDPTELEIAHKISPPFGFSPNHFGDQWPESWSSSSLGSSAQTGQSSDQAEYSVDPYEQYQNVNTGPQETSTQFNLWQQTCDIMLHGK